MSNKHHPPLLSFATAAYLVTGIALVMSSSTQLLASSSLSGQGTTVVHNTTANAVSTLKNARGTFVPSTDDAELRLLLGSLIILGGVGFHAYSVAHALPSKLRKKKGKSMKMLHSVFLTRLV
jgi:hypothetical protein